MSIFKNLFLKLLKNGKVIYKTDLSPRAIHIRIQNDSIKHADYIVGDFLRTVFETGNETESITERIRSYSIWNINKEKGEIDIALAIHSQGPGAESAKKSKVGDSLYFTFHKSKFTIEDADSYLFIGDLSALGQLYELNRKLPKAKTIESIVYSQKETDFFTDIDGQKPFTFFTLEENPSEQIIQKLPEVLSKLKGKKLVYIAGDSRVCVSLTQYFRRDLKWDSKAIKTKAYWNPLKKGLE